MKDLLSVNDLSAAFRLDEGNLLAVRRLSFSIGEGETLGLVGESGCGKSVSAFSVLRLVSPPGHITGGSICYRGRNLLALDEKELMKIRGKEIAMIFQEPMTSLNPVLTAGFQISEVLRLHMGLSKKEASERSAELLALVGIPRAAERISSYPHELSGGMRQRVMIAMALAASPSLLIADEPTTALDVTIQAQILELLTKLRIERNMSMLLISHDLGVVSNMADRIAVMYAGEIVEQGRTEDIFERPLHPYTEGLLRAIPEISNTHERLYTIPGTVPVLMSEPELCVFYPRCERASKRCREWKPELRDLGQGRSARCVMV